jgi:hypothetical protein
MSLTCMNFGSYAANVSYNGGADQFVPVEDIFFTSPKDKVMFQPC